jgi:uncharacterized protein with HEPN domain
MDDERVRDRLRHMLEVIAAIERLTAGKTLADYSGNPDMAAAIERYIERISEASRHLPEDLKTSQPQIEWRGVADVGNVLRHTYDQVSDRRIWQIITDDLAPLKTAVEKMLAQLPPDG